MISTYVSYKGKWWCVSTVNSEPYGHKYAKTSVWVWNIKTQKIEQICHTDSDVYGSISTHQKIIEKIHKHGAFWETVGDLE